MLPFLQMTNALQLHLKLSVLDDSERINVWTPGSYLVQPSPFVKQKKTFVFPNLFDKRREPTQDDHTVTPPLHYPAYLLLTNKYIYIARPLFRQAKIKSPLQDEQTTYFDPSKLIHIYHKVSILDMTRIDVGPGRQYLVFHAPQYNKSGTENISILFQTRSRNISTLIIDTITTLVHELNQGPIINQDIEWCIKSMQDSILLQPGPKPVKLMTYDGVWPTTYKEFSNEEFDTGISDKITKVDFDFLKVYLFGVFLRYIRPVLETEARGVEIQHVTFMASRSYIYVLQERLDVWPPAVFPPEYNHPFRTDEQQKGFIVDFVSQFSVLGVARIDEITCIQRWRSWRIDFDGFKGLGRALQNGHIGYLGQSLPHLKQQASAAGWFWWLRLHFGAHLEDGPIQCPSSHPQEGYFWDICFSTKESCDDFVEGMQAKRNNIKIVIGDD